MECLNLVIVSALHLVLWRSLLYRQRYIVPPSSERCTYCKSPWIKTSIKCPTFKWKWCPPASSHRTGIGGVVSQFHTPERLHHDMSSETLHWTSSSKGWNTTNTLLPLSWGPGTAFLKSVAWNAFSCGKCSKATPEVFGQKLTLILGSEMKRLKSYKITRDSTAVAHCCVFEIALIGPF